jgi:hypothetical protein
MYSLLLMKWPCTAYVFEMINYSRLMINFWVMLLD